MEDKLFFKGKRPDWIKILSSLGLTDYFLLDDSYVKLRSNNRKAFNWFLKNFGRKNVSLIRSGRWYLDDQFLISVRDFKSSHVSLLNSEEVSRIARVKWIKEV